MIDEIREIDLGEGLTAVHVLQLQYEAYQMEAELIGSSEIPLLKETLDQLQASDEIFIGYYKHGILVAVLAYKVADREIDIHRMMVNPKYFRRGIARKLLEYLEQIELDVQTFIVATGAENKPAIRLYQELDYVYVNETVVTSGIRIVHFKKHLHQS